MTRETIARLTLYLIAIAAMGGTYLFAQEGTSPSDRLAETKSEVSGDDDSLQVLADQAESDEPATGGDDERKVSRQDLVASLTIFVLAVFVGFEVITKVPPTLHTPLMSGSNAISGITVVGAMVVASAAAGGFVSRSLGFIAVAMATVNVVGGFLVTHRMLAMFKKK